MAGSDIHTMPPRAMHTPTREGAAKPKKAGISATQKQALMNNLQLEVTERARKMRAQYSLQAQGLRTRIENRVHRIPETMRGMSMADLMQRVRKGHAPQKAVSAVAAASHSHRPPPVPEKDFPPARPMSHTSTVTVPASRGPGRPQKRSSDEMSGGNKENIDASQPSKRVCASPAADSRRHPSQVLSPASSNSRIIPRKRVPAPAAAPPPSPAKPHFSRPPSPTKKPSSSNLLTSMMEKARSTRAAAASRKTTASSTASSATGGPPSASSRTRRGAAAAAATTASTGTRPATAMRVGRRVSAISESSDGSTSTVVRKKLGDAPAAPPKTAATSNTRRTVMSTIKKGVAGATTRKAAAPRVAAPSTASAAGAGRVLRRRG